MPNPHITVPDEEPLKEYDVVVSRSEFPFTFTFFDRDDLRVTVNDRQLDADEYEVTGTTGYEGGYPGGTVTLDVAVTNSSVRIYSDLPPVRLNDFLEGGGFRATPVNTEIDRLTARQRDTRLRFQRIPTFSDSTDRPLVNADMGALWTNKAASGAIDLTLPPASAGLHVWFAVVNAFALNIVCNADDEIDDDGATGTEMLSSTVGSIFHLICVDTGTWVVDSKNGTWALS